MKHQSLLILGTLSYFLCADAHQGQRSAPGVPPQQYQGQQPNQYQQQQAQQQQQYARAAPGVPPAQYQQPPQQQQYQPPPPPQQQQFQPPPQQQQYQQPPQQQYQQPPQQQAQQQYQQPAQPDGGHHHAQQQRVLHGNDLLEERDHIKDHMEVPLDTSGMSEEELQYHYFKMHDADNNNRLDGQELIKSLFHWHDASNHDPAKGNHPPPAPKIFTDEELISMIDPIMEQDDKNRDGFIDYPEFVNAQRKAAAAKADANAV